MMGGIHSEMAAFKALGTFLKGSGWIEALTAANITKFTTPGTAESFLTAGHVKRCRHAHDITAWYNIFCRSEHTRITSLGLAKIFLLMIGARESRP